MNNEDLINILKSLPMNAETVIVGSDIPATKSIVEIVYNESGQIEIIVQ